MTEVVSSILGPLLQKLASPAVEEIQLVWDVKDELEKLKNTLEMIQKLLADAEQKQTKQKAVKLWLSKLKDFCYDAEDVLDEFETNALCGRVRWTEHLTLKRKVRYLSSWLSNFIFQFKMAHKMKELGKRLDRMNEEKIKFNLLSDIHEKAIVPWRETYSFVRTSKIIGRDEEKEMIIELLKRSDDGGVGIAVIPILGMGGTGKTALAQLVYNDDRVKEHFKDNKFWLSMPIQFDVEKIIRDMVKVLDRKKKDDILEMQQNYLRSRVENKRCLFVMDNVWQVTREEWEQSTDLLGGVSKGSKIIVTSRYKFITSIMGTCCSFDLANLSWEDSLNLFVNCAFDQGKEKNRPDLMVIGKEIVRKCGENPLAVKTLGSLLYSKHNQKSDWEYIRDSEIWQLDTGILPSLRISSDLMPSYLKQCFAYLSIFPENSIFEKIELIELWISNGFIQSRRKNLELEEIGRQYFEELLSRSFFDVVEDDYPFLTFKMHDLIHDLAISVAQTESCNVTKERTQDISASTRHISFFNTFDVPKDELRGCLSKLSRVRTVIFEKLGSSEEFFLETCIGRFKHLRVLLLQQSTLDLLPSSIGSLKHLRNLTLYDSRNLKKLPKSVCKLRNLQYLDLGWCRELEELPADIKNMINLRLLVITTKQQHFLEGGIGCLTSLRWLFILWCENLETLFNAIQSLTSLRVLAIISCPKLASLPQGIKNLRALEDLWIEDCEILRLPEGESNEPRSMSRLQSFRFKKLPEVVSLPRWLESSASTLQNIIIADCPDLRVLPEWLQNCSSLKKLEIQNCRRLSSRRLSSLPEGIRGIATIHNEDSSSDEEEGSIYCVENSD